jgi:hypothetical protein
MRNKKVIFFVALCAFFSLTIIKGRVLVLRSVWIDSFKNTFLDSICLNLSDQILRCAFEPSTTCQPILSNAVDECLNSESEPIPLIIFNPTSGQHLQQRIRECVSGHLSTHSKTKIRLERQCVELLHDTPLATQSDNRNWRFLQEVLNSESMQALEEDTPGIIGAVYRRGVENETFGKEIVLVQIEARKKLILFAEDSDVLDFARARFDSILLLCKHSESSAFIQKLAGTEDLTEVLERMRSQDLNRGGELQDLGGAIASVPYDQLQRLHKEQDKPMAKIIRNAKVKRTAEPSIATVNSAFERFEALLSKDELETFTREPLSCKSTEVFSQKAFQLDSIFSVPIMKQVFR